VGRISAIEAVNGERRLFGGGKRGCGVAFRSPSKVRGLRMAAILMGLGGWEKSMERVAMSLCGRYYGRNRVGGGPSHRCWGGSSFVIT